MFWRQDRIGLMLSRWLVHRAKLGQTKNTQYTETDDG